MSRTPLFPIVPLQRRHVSVHGVQQAAEGPAARPHQLRESADFLLPGAYLYGVVMYVLYERGVRGSFRAPVVVFPNFYEILAVCIF